MTSDESPLDPKWLLFLADHERDIRNIAPLPEYRHYLVTLLHLAYGQGVEDTYEHVLQGAK